MTAAADRLADAVRILRTDPAADDPAPEVSVADLVARARTAGLDAHLEIPAAAVPSEDPVVAATVHRVVAEALTNAMKHAPGARVVVTVSTADDGPEPDGTFVVRARLPRRAQLVGDRPPPADRLRRDTLAATYRARWRAVRVATTLGALAVALVLGYAWVDAAGSALAPAATAIIPGTPVADVGHLLPAWTRTDRPSGVPTEPPGTQCRYYGVLAHPFGRQDLYRLCLRDDRIVGVDRVHRRPAGDAP